MTGKKVCKVCDFELGKEKWKKCPKCEIYSHVRCLKINRLISPDGEYYCSNHLPQEFVHISLSSNDTPSNIQEQPQNINPSSQNVDLIPSNPGQSQPNQGKDNGNKPQGSGLPTEPNDFSDLFVNLLNEAERARPKGQSTRNNTKNNLEESEYELEENNEKMDARKLFNVRLPQFIDPRIPISRMPNTPSIRNPPGALANFCSTCKLKIMGHYFVCSRCKEFHHEDCINDMNRFNQIEGYWCCIKCFTEWARYVSMCNYSGNDQERIDRRDEYMAERIANMRPEDPYIAPRRNSIFPGNAYMPARENLSKKQQILEENVVKENVVKQNCNIPERREEGISRQDVAEMMQLFQEQQIQMMNRMFENFTTVINNKLGQGNCQSQQPSTSRSSNNREVDAGQVRTNVRRSEIDRIAMTESTLHDLDNILDENPDLLRRRSQQEIANNARDMNENALSRLAETQIAEHKKNTYRVLPKVKNANFEWKVFYRTFLETKILFTPQENVSRIQQAILSDEIKDMGGYNLFSLETYESTLADIDKRVGKPERMLLNEKQSLLKQKKLHNEQRKETIRFIGEIKKYATLVDKIGSHQHKSDYVLVLNLSKLLPDRLFNSWMKEFTRIKNDTGEILIGDLSDWLDRQIDELENVLMIDAEGLKMPKDRDNRMNDNRKNFKSRASKESFFTQTEADDFKKDSEDQDDDSSDSPANYCWYHNKRGHSSLNCYTLLCKSGYEVSELAKTKGICDICSRKAHKICPFRHMNKCYIPSCDFHHAAIFCYKRRVQNSTQGYRSNRYNDRNRSRYQNDKNEKYNGNNNSSNRYGYKNNTNSNDNNKEKAGTSHQQHTMSEASAKDMHKNQDAASSSSNSQKAQKENSSKEVLDSLHVNAIDSDDEDETEALWTIVERTTKVKEKNEKVTNMTQTSYTSRNLFTVVCLELTNGNKTVKCGILLDSGSTASLIDEDIANFLMADGPNKKIEINWSGGKSREDTNSRIIKIRGKGFQKDARTYDIYFRTMKDLKMPKQRLNAEEMKRKFPHLKDTSLVSYNNIVGVIGADQKWFLKQLEWIDSKTNKEQSPTAILTPLGYTLIGSIWPLPKLYYHMSENNSKHAQCVHLNDTEEYELMKMQDRGMGLDYRLPYENDRCIADDERAIKILEEKTVKLKEKNKFQVPLLWNKPDVMLPTEESYKVAMKRLLALIKHAKRLGKFDELIGQIRNLIQKNYANKLSIEEIKNSPNNALYNPYFIVDQEGKRIRLVWDAAAKINEKSLNDYLLPGPNLYADLTSLLMQLREGKYFVKADISEMFHQVEIIPEDRPALRFLFINEDTNEIEHYQMNVMVFGAVCAPSTSQYIKNRIAKENKDKFAIAAEVIEKNVYVDDLVKSFNDVDYGKKMIFDVRNILKSGGFNLVKLGGNHPELMEMIKNSLTEEEKNDTKVFCTNNIEKLLGYTINYEKDTLKLAFNLSHALKKLIKGLNIPSKKEVLKFMMSIYDPLGFYGFYTSKIKLLYHWACRDKLEWNEIIKEKHHSHWERILSWIPDVIDLEIPRPYCVDIDKAKTKQLIIFGDAGKEMVCTAAYIRLLDKERTQIGFRFVASKTYTVPLSQKRTIPELELEASARSVKFKNQLVKAHNLSFDEIIYLTDSSCVFSWIKNEASRATIYMENRLKTIKESSNKEEWNWIPTDLQAADFGTKFESIPALSYNNDWFCPKVFSLDEKEWLRLEPEKDEAVELLAQIEKEEELKNYGAKRLINYYSSWNKLMKSTNIMLKFKALLRIKVLQNKIKDSQDEIVSSSLEQKVKQLQEAIGFTKILNQTESALIRIAQEEDLQNELEDLKKNGELKATCNLHKFTPFIDELGVMRAVTRLPENEGFEYNRRNPYILPKNHRLTQLIIMQYHKNNKHSFTDSVVVSLRQKYFIANTKCTVQKTIRALCYKCKRLNAKPAQPMMGDLPGTRLAIYENPFSYNIVDTCGPFIVKVNRKTEKRWLFVVSCLTTRAVFISVLYSMNSESCLMALSKLINARGAPKRMISDKGSNFIGGSNIFQEKQEEWNKDLIERGIIVEPIEWDFNPAKASHMNGSVERVIGMIKQVLFKMHDTMNKRLIIPNDEVFSCMIKEIEGTINNRPLSMIPMEGTTDKYLTPNHFLMLRPNFQINPSCTRYAKSLVENWEDIKKFIGSLWGHFQKFYINELLYREKWFDKAKKLEVGDIVVTADPTIYNLWRLGTIVEIQEGSKDQVRKVTVKLGKRNSIDEGKIKSKASIMKSYKNENFSIITRPATQVAALELRVEL